MNTPPPRASSEMSWFRDQSPATSKTPSTPRQGSRSSDSGVSTLVNPTSSLLQGLIKEQRASRGARGTLTEVSDEDGLRTPEPLQEDTPSERQRKINGALSAGLKQPREMGVREMDQYVSKINKLNFDLKLEIFHRTQQMAALEQKLARMQELENELKRMHELEDELDELRNVEDDNQRLRESNEELREELDKRDQAITEAVELICQLEQKVEELEETGDISRNSTPRPHSSDGPRGSELLVPEKTPPAPIAFDIPERKSSRRGTSMNNSRQVSLESRHLKRAPSFLREENRNTATLRSLYAPSHKQSHSPSSVVTKTESVPSVHDGAESPRLSVLSECSDLNPFDSPTRQKGFDQLQIPIRSKPVSISTTDSFLPDLEEYQGPRIRVDQWISPRPDPFEINMQKRRNRASLDVLKQPYQLNYEDGAVFNRESKNSSLDQKSRAKTTVYGGSRLPPTPDTMSTAHAGTTNRSNGSSDKGTSGQNSLNQGHQLARPRSADELTLRRDSGNSELADSLDLSCGPSMDHDRDDDVPTLFPFGLELPKAAELLGPAEPLTSKRSRIFKEDGMESIYPSNEEGHSPSVRPTIPISQTPEPTYSSPPLTPQDWIDAAKLSPRPRISMKRRAAPVDEDSPNVPQAGTHHHHGLAGSRAPSQTAFLSRRFSIGSGLEEPELHLDQTLPNPPRAVAQEQEPKKRRSLRPTFFGRSHNARRLQPSPIAEPVVVPDDSAPSPIIRKTRQATIGKRDGPVAGHGNVCALPMPTYAEGNTRDITPQSLSQSFTESHISSYGSLGRPTSSHGAEHKRRGSLGIFGWMKQSGTKRSEPSSPVASNPFLGEGVVRERERERASSRLAYESPAPDVDPPVSCSRGAALDADVIAANAKYQSRIGEEESARRPRYMDRRARRA
ncbi:hypothetical protein ASPZODRAFT_14140 [Penicilliopsis zonata CBS 506.65]|uniref:Centrosomin N-terminal motif 1 domain-containing protein n=1 Tax=Penicilliopsis zonata CBS 506.65 TaxID=1073090 RepID=A0A1L9SQL9_9EURO|nr:hypothetical protein ASPZODRAFT_14140 [Penicilliopsis zonata CBS 506.65]OJJ49426.1 hypothetical protein ASPZODRAFT_14140 [Penicilliopsis zonata CBS 506.65]